ncbi:MAG: DUF2807 domain-containing protein [Chloroflexota bacterium]|nr:MAG: DUF2807 domain-containing protein [Chloroflexota bacterium]
MITRRALVSVTLMIVITILTTLVGGCVESFEKVTGSGELTTWDFDHKDFKRIEAGSGFKLDIAKSDSYLVRITFDNNLLQYLDIKKKGDILHIGLEPKYNYSNCAHSAHITLPDLRELNLSGTSQVKIKGFQSSHAMRFELSGNSSININDLEAGDIRCEI